MNIYQNPDTKKAIDLLRACDLPISDLQQSHMATFLGCGETENPKGIIGLEIHGKYGLLRSLAVAPEARSLGCGKELVSSIENVAKTNSLESIFLLTTTAENFFNRIGYRKIARSAVPEAIKDSTEYSGVCPDSATVMVKRL